MSSMFPPFGGQPPPRCQRCGVPLAPNVVNCMNCGAPVALPQAMGQAWTGAQSPSSVVWGGSTAQVPPGVGQFGGQQWGQPVPPPSGQLPFAQPFSFSHNAPGQSQQLGDPFSPQLLSFNNNQGFPQQPSSSSPPGTWQNYWPESMNAQALNGYAWSPVDEKRRPRVGLVILIVSLVIIVLASGGFASFLLLNNQANKSTPTETAGIPTPSVKPLFSDSFNNNNNKWDLSGTPGKFVVSIGGGSMVLEDDENKLFMEVVPGSTFADFRLDVDAKLSKGDPNNGYGVFVRGALNQDGNLDTYYRFELYGDGTYAVFKGFLDASGNLQSTRVAGYATDPAILKEGQVNHITILATGSSMTFVVNGKSLVTYSDSSYKSGSVALFVSNLPKLNPGAQATFSSLAIYPPAS